MKTLLAIALAVGLSLAGSVATAAAEQPGAWRQPADPWARWGRQHEQHRGGWDGRHDENRGHWDRGDHGGHSHHWYRGHWYGPPVVVHPPHRVPRVWVPGRWAWNGYWVWVPGYWAY